MAVRSVKWFSAAIALGLLLVPSTTSANTGIPMILVTGFGLAVGLPAVVAIEVVALSVILKRRAFELVASVTVANLISTLVGYPLAWIALLVWQLFVSFVVHASGMNAGLGSYDTAHGILLTTIVSPAWAAPIGAYESLVMTTQVANLAVAFYASLVIEGYYLSRALGMRRDELRRPVLRAHVLSYVALLAGTEIWMAMQFD